MLALGFVARWEQNWKRLWQNNHKQKRKGIVEYDNLVECLVTISVARQEKKDTASCGCLRRTVSHCAKNLA